jgi:hypothetical protein
MWEIEDIPDSDLLYYRIHISEMREGEIIPGAFKERGEGPERGMSTNWNKYSKPELLKNVATNPNDNAIVQFQVQKVRAIGSLIVKHAPLPANRSHSHIKGIPKIGQLKTKVRAKLQEIYEWNISFPNEKK